MSDTSYRMLLFLEEPIDEPAVQPQKEKNHDEEASNENARTTHEFVDELILPFKVDELDTLNEWFDKFDEEICIPHEGHIKYEISNDGLVVLLLDKTLESVVDDVRKFVELNQ